MPTPAPVTNPTSAGATAGTITQQLIVRLVELNATDATIAALLTQYQTATGKAFPG